MSRIPFPGGFGRSFQTGPSGPEGGAPRPPRAQDMKPSRASKNAKRVTWAVLLVLLLAVTALNSVYSINEQENAVVTTFGVPHTVSTSGLHFKIPFIQQVHKVDMTIRGVAIGYDPNTNASIDDESLMITSDFNFVNVDFFLEYRVTDPIQYLYASEQPATILKTLAQSYIRDTIGLYPVDDVITTGKNQIQSEIKEKIIDRLEAEQIGLQLVNITIQDAEPPTAEVLAAFKEVENAPTPPSTTPTSTAASRSRPPRRRPIRCCRAPRPRAKAASTRQTARWRASIPCTRSTANSPRSPAGACTTRRWRTYCPACAW